MSAVSSDRSVLPHWVREAAGAIVRRQPRTLLGDARPRRPAHGGYAFDAGHDVLAQCPLVRLPCVAPLINEMVLDAVGGHVLGLPRAY